jgi:hypothetical protein
MRYIISLCLLLFTTTANADSGSVSLALPSAPGNYQSDKFKAGDLDCSNAIGSATQLELGVTGLIDGGYYDDVNRYINDRRVDNVGVYARIVIPLGARPKERIDCNRLYEMELQLKSLELERLRRELQQLKELSFEE